MGAAKHAKQAVAGRGILLRGRRRRRFLVLDVPPLWAFRRLTAVTARAFRIAERQPHLEGEIGAKEIRDVGAVGLQDEAFVVLAKIEIVEQDVARAIVQHVMHRLPRGLLVERRVEEFLDPG